MPEHTINDFVFLDELSRPFRIRKTNLGNVWLHHWNADKRWMTVRRITSLEELQRMFSHKLPPEKTVLYEAGVPFLT